MTSKTPNLLTFTVSDTLTVDLGYNTQIVSLLASGITVNLNLPTLVGIGDGETVRFKRLDTDATSTLIINAFAGQTISGSPSVSIPVREELNLVSLGLEWYIISDPGITGTSGTYLSTQHLFVDSIIGDDGTAVINDSSKPWKTITAAVIASEPLLPFGNYLIYVRAGEYNNEGNLLISVDPGSKQRFYFEAGTIIQGSGVLFEADDEIENINAEITGYGVFRSVNLNPIVFVTVPGTFYFEASQVIGSGGFPLTSVNTQTTFKVRTVTGTGSGVTAIGSNLEIDNIDVSSLGVCLGGCRGIIGSITAEQGVFLDGDNDLEIREINSIYIGIQIYQGVNHLGIGTISGATGILISENVTLTGSVDTMSSYLNSSSGSVTDTLKIGTITSGIYLSGSGNYTSNWDINFVSGNLTVSGTGARNLTSTIQNLSGDYLNTGTGSLIENLTFGSVNEIIFNRNDCICNWNINSGGGINLQNSNGTGIFNIQANSITGIVIQNSQNYEINLDIGTITAETGIYNLATGSVILTGTINEINSTSNGYSDESSGDVTETLTIGSIDSQESGIIFSKPSGNVISNLTINSIVNVNESISIGNTGGTGFFNLQVNSIVSSNIGIRFYGNQKYIGNLKIGTVSADIGIILETADDSRFVISGNQLINRDNGLIIENLAPLNLTLDINSIEISSGIGLLILNLGILTLNGEIKKIQAFNIGYYNLGAGQLIDNLNFGSIEAPTGIQVQRSSGDVTVNWNINSIMATDTGIFINNTGNTGIYNVQANLITAGPNGIIFAGTQNYFGKLNLNTITAINCILLQNAARNFKITANELNARGLGSGLSIQSDGNLNIDLEIGTITGDQYGIYIFSSGSGQINGSVKKIIATDIGYYNSNANNIIANLIFGSVFGNNNAINISNGTLNGYVDYISNDSNSNVLLIDRGLFLGPMTFGFGTVKASGKGIACLDGYNNLYGQQIVGNGANNGIDISAGQTKITVDYITNCETGISIAGGLSDSVNGHQIFVKRIDGLRYAILSTGNYIANFSVQGTLISRDIQSAISLQNINPTPGNTTASVRILGETFLQSKGATYSLTASNPATVITVEGPCYFNPQPNPALTYQNDPTLRTVITNSWL